MKKLTPLIAICFALLFNACEPKGVHDNNANYPGDTPEIADTKKPSSGKDSVRAWAEGILSGKNIPSDDNLTFACLDSLSDKNKEVRIYYRKVYEVIDQHADGALSEALASYVISYFEHFTQEAFDYYNASDSNSKASVEFKIAEECYFDGDNALKSLDTFFADLHSRCGTCDKETAKAMKQKIKAKIVELNND